MSAKHEISCWQCSKTTSLETRSEFDGCCWACGAEIDLEDYLIKAMDERDQLRAEVEALRPIHAMILNALDRDAEEGKAARGEMAAELRAAIAAKEA